MDYLVPKGLASGPDGKDFAETFKNGLKQDSKRQQQHGKKRKRTWKRSVTIELLNYDTGNAKKVGEYVKDQVEKNLKGVTVNIKLQPFKQKLKLESDQDYDFSYGGWNPDYADPMTYLDMFETKIRKTR